MPDDCPVDDESRRALRNLARQAEWHGRPGPAGAALDARTLRDLGRELELVLARDPEPDPEQATWAHRASSSLAAYCQRAQPDWTVQQIAELTRLREDAMTALAPGPGESQADPEPARRSLPFARSLGSRRPAVLALAAVCCLVLIALVLTLPHLLSSGTTQTPAASATTTIPATAPTQLLTTPATSTATGTSTATTTSTSAPAGAPTTAASTSPPDNSHATSIQFSNPPVDEPGIPPDTSPKVVVTVDVTASGTGDITITFAITGSSGQPQTVQESESGDTSYGGVTQPIPLSQWCGQSTVRLTVSSPGAVPQSATVAVSGC
jgi:hypothetical protein